jgi:hypothetical protein
MLIFSGLLVLLVLLMTELSKYQRHLQGSLKQLVSMLPFLEIRSGEQEIRPAVQGMNIWLR